MSLIPSTLALSMLLLAGAAPGDGSPPHPPAPPASVVSGVTVPPAAPVQPRTVAGGDAAPLTSPGFKDEDAKPAPRALSLGDGVAAGVQSVDTARPAGIPASIDQTPPHADLGVTAVF